ncbi:unnamed protein product [Acidithrix sp. C25]|nr:unnamed protein product [Acidithrix sp. C25]
MIPSDKEALAIMTDRLLRTPWPCLHLYFYRAQRAKPHIDAH